MKNKFIQPQNTFWNLSDSKRQRIEEALVLEFASEGYRKASLNRVVKELGIAKGSLYQYFANKEAIFLFIFERFTRLVKDMAGKPAELDGTTDFWGIIRQVLMAAIAFVDKHPAYYQLYLRTLFERDVPRREEIISRVRLFSLGYFGPLVEEGQRRGVIRPEISGRMVVFMIDAAMDRFLQGYVHSYLDDGLGLADKGRGEIVTEIEMMLDVLRHGLAGLGLSRKDKEASPEFTAIYSRT